MLISVLRSKFKFHSNNDTVENYEKLLGISFVEFTNLVNKSGIVDEKVNSFSDEEKSKFYNLNSWEKTKDGFLCKPCNIFLTI